MTETVDEGDGAADGGDDVARHELEEFLEQDQSEIAAEYERIYSRSNEDPGTAGDEGEENWAELLRKWLPSTYQFVTKGRIVFPDKTASPQIDVLVLRATYPPRLLTKKLYLSSGVVAAFECKNTLKAQHITDAAKTARLVKSKATRRRGTPRDELHAPPVYGLLAHSHSWKRESSTPIDNIDRKIIEVLQGVTHPSQLIDVVCVADLAAWTLSHFLECPWFYDNWELRIQAGAPPDGSVSSAFCRYVRDVEWEPPTQAPNPVAVLIAELLGLLGWEDRDLRPIADYFRIAGLLGYGYEEGRLFGFDVLSPEVQERLRHQPPTMGLEHLWDPWSMVV